MQIGGAGREPGHETRSARGDGLDVASSRAPRRRRRLGGAIVLCVLVLLPSAACSRRKESAGPPTSDPTPIGASGTVPGTDAAGGPRGSTVPTAEPAPTVLPAVATTGASTTASMKGADGRERTYHVYVPASLPKDEAVPLLVGLHGGFGSGEQFEQQSGFDGLAEANRFIAVYPDGISIPVVSKGRVWNGGGCCPPAEQDKQNVNDVAFIAAVIDEMSRQHRIDTRRVFVTGHSNGGIMAYRLGCELADKVAAIGMQAGTLFVEPCEPARPVALIEIHGTADQNIPITGGVGDRSLSAKDFPSPAGSVQRWAKLNGCSPQPSEQIDNGNRNVAYDLFSGCHDGATVEMVRVTGANHAWMGHEASKTSEVIVGTPYMQFDSSFAIWSFLASHPRR